MVMMEMTLKVKVILECDFWDTQAEHPFLYLRQQLLDYGKDFHQALKLWKHTQNKQLIFLWLRLIKNMTCKPVTGLHYIALLYFNAPKLNSNNIPVLCNKEHHPHLRLVQLPSSGGTCIISLLERSKVDSLFRIFSRTPSMPPTWLLLIKMVSRDEVWYNTSGNDLNLMINDKFCIIIPTHKLYVQSSYVYQN